MRWPEHAPAAGSRGGRALVVAGALLVATAELAVAQSAGPALQLDTASLGHGPYSRMRTKLEKTIFKVDVLTVEVRFAEDDAVRLRELAGGRRYSEELADSLAAVAMQSRDAFVEVRFLRDVGLDQFLGGVHENLRRVLEVGLIERSRYEIIRDGLPRWFGFLRERGIHKRDRILYRIRGDTLRTWFLGDSGTVMLNQTDVGPERRLAVLGGYFVHKSDFHKGLIRSLFRAER
jgi:hypothetical protein